MKKTRIWIIAAAIASMAVSSLMAQVTPVSIDFGTDVGRQTYEDANFAYFEENTNAGITEITNLATAVEFTCTSRYQSGIEQTFAGLGVGQTDPFTISMDLTIDSLVANSNLRRVYGIRMFGAQGNGDSGLAARLVSDSDAPDEIQISNDGASGTGYEENISTNWNGGEIQTNVAYTFTVDGNFVGAGNLRLVFTVSDGVDSHTITNVVAAAALDGDYFGIVGDADCVVSVSSWSLASLSVPADNTAPSVPSNLVTAIGDSSVILDWADSTDDSTGDSDGVAFYNIYRSTTSGSGFAVITNAAASAYVDTTVVNGTTYYYKVSAVDGSSNESALSDEATATPVADTTPPTVPQNLAATGSDGKVSLSWDASTDTQSAVAYYNVYRSTTSGSGFSVITNVTDGQYFDLDVVNDTTYYYTVSAVDSSAAANESAQSAEASATPEQLGNSVVVTFGSNNDGLGGFTQTAADGSNVFWTTNADSVQFRSQALGTVNSSFLGLFSLDRTPGKKYNMKGEITMTGGYAADNNRLGFYLFGNSPAIPNEDEAGAIGVIFNTDDNSPAGPPGSNSDDDIGLYNGIDNGVIGSDVKRVGDPVFAQDLFGTTVEMSADFEYVFSDDFSSTNVIITGYLTTPGGITTVGPITNAAADHTGEYFGFVNRARCRSYDGDPAGDGSAKDDPWVMDYKTFTYTDLSGGGGPVLTDFEQYLVDSGLASDAGAETDSDGDGLANLYEYGIGGNPNNVGDTGTAPAFAKDGAGFIYVYPRRTDTAILTYTVETNTNLLNSGSWVAGTTEVGTDGGSPLEMVTNSVTTVEDEKFIRLKIEQ